MFAILVVLDACVLVADALRNAILRAAAQRLCTVRWSDDILEEVRDALEESRHRTPGRVQRIIDEMEFIVPEGRVTDYERRLRDVPRAVAKGDHHVVAAALVAGARAIVTSNVAHFPEDALSLRGLRVLTPDQFLYYLVKHAPQTMADIIQDQASVLKYPPRDANELLDIIAQDCPDFAAAVRRILAHR